MSARLFLSRTNLPQAWRMSNLSTAALNSNLSPTSFALVRTFRQWSVSHDAAVAEAKSVAPTFPEKLPKEQCVEHFNKAITDLTEVLAQVTPHTHPPHSRLNNLVNFVPDAAAAARLPALVRTWRAEGLPITPYTTNTLIFRCAQVGAPKVALTLLQDRAMYGQRPTANYLHHLMRAFGEQAVAISRAEPFQPDAYFAALDNMFRTFALFEYYELEPNVESYSTLVKYCCEGPSKEAFRRAAATVSEAVSFATPMIDRETALKFQEACTTHGDTEKRAYIESILAKLN
ncbi:hypothetical protein H4R33_006228 [Dimargaris cristalligena]|uniref:Uncharacterized protein n=1 Tax=Dimargaris cristalligena TaxID=215637 RepID=A0A4P9ZP09_9FUNG|nr:hypothetical protein H4R33_006228 [Dimargaris cristalligena]RKP34080.1 hypothetical protein BJ085DRAFT_32083 [Dimargaris cristalligena]|eukprot:RKP34080.1 hypothetical protein BJ085DRAFT_32083 [Dimargaris cristalligena]